MSLRSGLLAIGLRGLWGCSGSCGGEATEPPTLGEVTVAVQFASVERLGPHAYTATVTRVEQVEGAETSTQDETVELRWQDWDHFRLRRLANGERRSAWVVVDGTPWVRRLGGPWTRKDDAEPYRVQLRATWDLFAEAFDAFQEQILLVEGEREVYEGRPARRYQLTLRGPPEDPGQADPEGGEQEVGAKSEGQKTRPARLRSGPIPSAVGGSVLVDEGTAVRLQEDCYGDLVDGRRTTRVSLRSTRSGIGLDQEIRPPGKRRKAGHGGSKAEDPAGVPPEGQPSPGALPEDDDGDAP